jgi:hypothetical protein
MKRDESDVETRREKSRYRASEQANQRESSDVKTVEKSSPLRVRALGKGMRISVLHKVVVKRYDEVRLVIESPASRCYSQD